MNKFIFYFLHYNERSDDILKKEMVGRKALDNDNDNDNLFIWP